jgi:hypothetical protein
MLAAVGHVSSFHGHFLYSTLAPVFSEELLISENITGHHSSIQIINSLTVKPACTRVIFMMLR